MADTCPRACPRLTGMTGMTGTTGMTGMIRHLNPIRFRQGSGSKAGKTGRNDAQVLTAREQAHALAKRSSQASKRNDSEANAATKCMHFGMVESIGHAHSAMTRKF